MSRVTCSVARHRRKKRLMKEIKGNRAGRGKLLRTGKETSYRAMRYAFRDRKARKRDFRKLWITRISAALMPYGMNYSRFMGCLKHAQILLNRKMLSEMAIHDPKGFEALVELARKHVPTQLAKAQ